ncbi:DENN domain and WD repeat-containing protein SCD1-like [Macadamia integrifolia]|uniref:DENN domain and WD repeat-containing protein SCD1-like n=1 Tax=Macadamia integrifolia TaxID=60698 RepID=UPI001C4F018D|nr:DENN domain and WD repeat-containing protein SCD1-like [Macadamia integrifolia]
MAQIFEYFVVCGIGPEIRSLDGNRGFHGTGVMYLPSLLDQFPPSNHSLYPPPPPQLPTDCVDCGNQVCINGACVETLTTLGLAMKAEKRELLS